MGRCFLKAGQFQRIVTLSLISPWCASVPSPGQLGQRVQSVGNFPTTPRHPLKATAYVSPTVQQGPTSTPLSSSVSLQSIPTSTSLPQPLKISSSLVPQPLKASTNQSAVPRSSLPRPASFVGTGGVLRASKMTQPTRRWGWSCIKNVQLNYWSSQFEANMYNIVKILCLSCSYVTVNWAGQWNLLIK